MKKLRLRGDWSDTGPNSRPETESRDLEERASDGRKLTSKINTKYSDNIFPRECRQGKPPNHFDAENDRCSIKNAE